MSKEIKATAEKCTKTADKVNLVSKDKVHLWKIQAMQMKIRRASALLIENRNSLWINTKEGKAIINEIQESSLRIDRTLDEIIRENDQAKIQILLHAMEENVGTLEKDSDLIRIEVRKRSMTIT
jgi:hypothetical protein